MNGPKDIAGQLALFVGPTQWTELRALHVGQRGRTFAGWFDGGHLLDMARHALALTRQAAGVYFVPNPVNPDVAAKRANAVLNVPRGFGLTHDSDVLERRYLIVDLDPWRFAGDDRECPTDARELAFARRVARRHVVPFLAARGFAAPVMMSSGNGVHLVYRHSSPLPVAEWGRGGDPAAAALRLLADRFDCCGLKIDANTFNPCRMLKVPGTVARKGEATAARPHRTARILQVPDEWREPDDPPRTPEPAGRVEPGRPVGPRNSAPAGPAAHPALFDGGGSGSGAPPVH